MKNSLCYVVLLIMSALWQEASAQQSDTLFLYFDVSKSELSVEELNKLNAFCEANAKITKEIILEAYADSTGSATNNHALSAKRMDVVKTHLKNTKESFKSIIKASAMGETIKYGNDFQLNRCVELIFIYDEKKNINNLAAYAKGDKIVLENILFENNAHVFLPSSLPILKKLAETLKQNLEVKIEIQGHVCCGGNNKDHDLMDETATPVMKISESRAKAVYDYLIENGIESGRLKYIGLSFKYPRVFPENSEEDRGKNRRVEIEIL
jgi:outer membrane protein OmpA-like peptidoglycan-associated protein